MSKKCAECGATHSEEWFKLETYMGDPISVACSDVPVEPIPVTLTLCKTCHGELIFCDLCKDDGGYECGLDPHDFI